MVEKPLPYYTAHNIRTLEQKHNVGLFFFTTHALFYYILFFYTMYL